MEALLLLTIKNHLLASADQHSFPLGHSATSDLFRTVYVAVDLTASFYAVNDNILLSKIVRLTLPEATCLWLSNYIRGRQYVKSCIGVNGKDSPHWLTARLEDVTNIINFYLADMPQPTEPVK